MREVDQALARAFAQRAVNDHAGVPPAPHLPSRYPDPVGVSARAEGPPASGPAPEPEPVAFHWPATVLSLECKYGDRFERLADALLEARDRRHLKVLLFTSCHRAEGRTTLILALARALARRPGRTLLVDADLSGPMLARQLGIRPIVGLDDVIEEGLALNDALLEAPDDHLSLLPLRTSVGRPREFLGSAAWSGTMARLRREFDLVLLDGSPLLAGLGVSVPHQAVDAAVLIRNRSLTGDGALGRAREVLDSGGIPLLGLAETFV